MSAGNSNQTNSGSDSVRRFFFKVGNKLYATKMKVSDEDYGQLEDDLFHVKEYTFALILPELSTFDIVKLHNIFIKGYSQVPSDQKETLSELIGLITDEIHCRSKKKVEKPKKPAASSISARNNSNSSGSRSKKNEKRQRRK